MTRKQVVSQAVEPSLLTIAQNAAKEKKALFQQDTGVWTEQETRELIKEFQAVMIEKIVLQDKMAAWYERQRAENKTTMRPRRKDLDQLPDIQRANQISFETAVLAVFALLQKGATFAKARGTDSVSVGEFSFTNANLREAKNRIKAHKKTLRQCAKSNANEIYAVGKELQLPGNLAKAVCRKHPELHDERWWMSDFQSDNQQCPVIVRKAIQEQLTANAPKK